jgi:hypothetical protein
VQNKERILKTVKGISEFAYLSKHILITADFSTETLKAMRARNDAFQVLKESQPRLLYPANLSFITEGEINTIHDKQKLMQFMTSKSVKKVLKEILYKI